jgi:hypothetical protein
MSSTDQGGGKRRVVPNELVLAGCMPGATYSSRGLLEAVEVAPDCSQRVKVSVS